MHPLRVGLVASLLLVFGCANVNKNSTDDSAGEQSRVVHSRVVHVVLCWLKTPGDPIAQQKLIDESRSFVGEIPGLISVSAGRALPSTRPAVDSSFDVAVVMTFTDANALANYEKNPRHQQAVREILRPLTAKLIIYDFIDQPK